MSRATPLSRTAKYQIVRMQSGPVDCSDWHSGGFGSMTKAYNELTDGGYIDVRSTPKGRKRFSVLTAKGLALLPTIQAEFRAEQVEREKAEREQRAEETVRNAAPDLLSACEHSLRNVESMLHMLPLKADAIERQSLTAWAAQLRAAIARANGGAS